MIKTFLAGFQLPVNPFNELIFTSGMNSKSIDLISFGEIIKLGNRKPIELSFDSIFTDKSYPFVSISNPLPAIDYINKVHSLFNAKQPVRFIVTGQETDVNMLCIITGFKHSQKFGEEGEYYYTLALKEYRQPQVKRIVVAQKSNSILTSNSVNTRLEKDVSKTTYTVKKGDCLWNIAKQFYGNGNSYQTISDANEIKNNLILPGQTLTIPASVSQNSESDTTTSSKAPEYFNSGVSLGS